MSSVATKQKAEATYHSKEWEEQENAGLDALPVTKTCPLCTKPLADYEFGVHSHCAENENFLASL